MVTPTTDRSTPPTAKPRQGCARRWLGALGCGVLLVAGAAGCSSLDPEPAQLTLSLGGAGGAGGAGGVGAGGAGGAGGGAYGIAALSFAAPEPWAEPIADYLQAGYAHLGHWDFERGIHDLVAWQDRLYLGYGDATLNLGSVIPIEFRSFASHEQPTAVSEATSDEEQLDRYRLIADDLFMAGVDATEDAWLGNVYFRQPYADWLKSRTLDGGVHVHDVFDFAGALFAVGSGATETEWFDGEIFAHLWRSTDGGHTFEIFDRHDNGGGGDARWIRLLPLGDALYLFGYSTNAAFTAYDALLNGTFDGQQIELFDPNHELAQAIVFETDVLRRGQPDELGLLLGVDFAQEPLRVQLWRMAPSGLVAAVDQLAGQRVVDVYPHDATGQALVLVHEGDEYPAPSLSEWNVSILVTDDFESFVELTSFTTDASPRSIAFWRDCLFYGTSRGQLWRSVGAAPD